MKSTELIRCHWSGTDPIYIKYHDEIWGVPEFDPKALFAKLILDGAQAGLSWITILKRQPGYEAVFDGLDPEKIARYSDKKLEKILLDDRIIRNRLKVYSTRTNAI
ncbi:MAG TPA: DNA-3-methyladenine glycosylase I, partial [Saprospiraceae bacterium]|nr:DNA-3-methyladenine glycosylase I [Saprospiraceae bacterium]